MTILTTHVGPGVLIRNYWSGLYMGMAQVPTYFLTSNPTTFPNGNLKYSFLREIFRSLI